MDLPWLLQWCGAVFGIMAAGIIVASIAGEWPEKALHGVGDIVAFRYPYWDAPNEAKGMIMHMWRGSYDGILYYDIKDDESGEVHTANRQASIIKFIDHKERPLATSEYIKQLEEQNQTLLCKLTQYENRTPYRG